jgi:hemerythrin-like domain-containing protein
MPVVFGTIQNTFANPVGLLSDCHRRIESFLSTLLAVASHADGALDTERRNALETALKYFREAAPMHTADEEESLFPLLRLLGRPDISGVLQQLERLESDHKTAESWLREIEGIGQCWLRQEQICPQEATRLKDLVVSLSELYAAHIAMEEGLVFPMAEAELSESDKRVLGRAMASRRGLLSRSISTAVGCTE